MPSSPLPLNFQPYGPNYSPILMLPLDSYRYHLVAPNGQAASAVAIPAGARSMRVISLTADVWMRPSTDKTTNTVTVDAPIAAVTNGSAPAQIGAGGADSFLLPQGSTFVVFLSAGNLLVEWFA